MSEYNAVSAARRFAILNDQITELTNRVEELAREADEGRQQHDQDRHDVAAAMTAVAQWNSRLQVEGIGPTVSMRNAIKQLGEKVAGLDEKVTALAATLDKGKLKAPSAPRWDNLDQAEEAAQLAALREWVNGVLRVQYPGYTLPGCWPAHREALWELGALHAEWQRVFDGQRGVNLENMLWFHERWLPGTIGRLNKAINTDGSWCRTHHGGAYAQRPTGW